MSLVRIDPVTNKNVIFTNKRENRPNDLWSKEIFILKENNNIYEKYCPFCKGNECETPSERIDFPKENWEVSIIRNKYPIVFSEDDIKKLGEYSYITSGIHDVIIESDIHSKTYFNMTKDEFSFLYSKIHQRYIELLADDEISFVTFFKNYQTMAGASLYHSHSQMMSMNASPDSITNEILGCKKYHEEKDTCPYCDDIKMQIKKRDRLIYENEHFISIMPFAAGYKYETYILPKKHSNNFEDENNIKSLADAIYSTFRRMYNAIGNFPYNFYLHSSPKNNKLKKYYHYHFELIPRLSGGAGFELCTGIRVNSLLPEKAAEIIHKSNL